jgi:hypothetical protein
MSDSNQPAERTLPDDSGGLTGENERTEGEGTIGEVALLSPYLWVGAPDASPCEIVAGLEFELDGNDDSVS